MHKASTLVSGLAITVTTLIGIIYYVFRKNYKKDYNTKAADMKLRNLLINRSEAEIPEILSSDEGILEFKIIATVFEILHEKMKEVDDYYKQYALKGQFAGSQYDRLFLKKSPRHKVDITISLPINYDITDPTESPIFHNFTPYSNCGYIQLKMDNQFKNLPNLDNWRLNRIAYDWLDHRGYLRPNKFLTWFNGILCKALGKLAGECKNAIFLKIDGRIYRITMSHCKVIVYEWTDTMTEFTCFDLVPMLILPGHLWRFPDKIPDMYNMTYLRMVPNLYHNAHVATYHARNWYIRLLSGNSNR